MERHPRPPAARRRATRGLIAALALLCAACSHTTVNVQGGGIGSPGFLPGTSVSGGSVGVHVNGASAAAVLLGIAVLGIAAHAPHVSPPVMDEARRVQRVDCTRPIEDWSANLSCR
jgi:hypothetical protein